MTLITREALRSKTQNEPKKRGENIYRYSSIPSVDRMSDVALHRMMRIGQRIL